MQRGGDIYWPQDLAPETVPNSRVLTYGYDTHIRHRLQGPVSSKTVYDHARELLFSLVGCREAPNEGRRPILFIVHSLGGIILKEALRYSKAPSPADARLRAIFESTAGVIFFGTPHRGADPVGFVRPVIEATAKCLGVDVNEQIVNTPTPDAGK
jgi:hypothetical protein